MRYYCTLFDSNYAAQGLALYHSLVKCSTEPVTLYVLPLDASCEQILNQHRLPRLRTVSFKDFCDNLEMDVCRSNRNWKEFCWTCASNLCVYLLKVKCLEEITYLDADLFFFADPTPVFAEIAERSIGITPHRFITSKQHLEVNGQFNVGFVHFKNSLAGVECATRWAEDCRNRCSEHVGCGDQKYLDDWPWKYGDDVCQIDIGVNVGPWSLANWPVVAGPKLGDTPLVCYHFHEYVHDERLTFYDLRPEDKKFIYGPYIQAVTREKDSIARLHLQA